MPCCSGRQTHTLLSLNGSRKSPSCAPALAAVAVKAASDKCAPVPCCTQPRSRQASASAQPRRQLQRFPLLTRQPRSRAGLPTLSDGCAAALRPAPPLAPPNGER